MAGKKNRPRGLGRGLSALMADVAPTQDSSDSNAAKSELVVPVERVVPNPDQPRRIFTDDHLQELTASIKEKGIIQPLIVRIDPLDAGKYQIVAGERRWRAAQLAQLHEIPVIVRELDDTEVLEIAIIENIQRADLNPIEEAAGYRQLMDKFGHTQEKMATALGKSRSHIANLLRLLNLPASVQTLLQQGDLSTGHARALITSENPAELAMIVVRDGLSVRQTEKLAKQGSETNKGSVTTPTPPKPEKDADTKALEGDLSANLRMKVAINHNAERQNGRLEISYSSLEELDELCRLLSATD